MHTRTKYRSKVKTAVKGERAITIKNLPPILHLKERESIQMRVRDAFYSLFDK